MTRRAKSAVRKSQIVAATFELLAKLPLSDVTTRRIAAVVGISQPALFRHFRSREDVLLGVLAYAQGELAKRVETALSHSRSPEDRLVGIGAALTSFVETHPGLPRLLLADLGPAPAGTAVRGALQRLIALQRAIVTEIVKDGVEDGVLRADLAPDRLAAYFVSLVLGTVRQWELGGRATSLADSVVPLASFWLEAAAARAPRPSPSPEVAQRPTVSSLRALDTRPLLARGIDPLEAILAELDAAGPTGLLCLTAPFRPAPLIGLLSGRGHSVEVREGPPGTWSIDVVVGGTPEVADLSDLPAPEPLERVLEAAAQLPPEGVFIARVPRVPQLLLARLAERPELRVEHHERADGRATVRVTRVASGAR